MDLLRELVEVWGAGLHYYLRFDTQILIFLAVIIGIIWGALPGLSASMALAIFTPFTFGLAPYQGIAFLVAIYAAVCFGGAISAILVKIPGAPSSVCTVFDGYPMALRGEAGRAIGIAALASSLGALVGLIALMFFSPLLVLVARKFGTWEYTLLALMGLTMISYVASGSMLKGLIGGILGLALSTIGQDPFTGFPRFTMGQIWLLGGVNFVAVLIGLFGMAEALLQLEKEVKASPIKQKIVGMTRCFKDVASNFWTLLRSSIIGTFIGAIPAVGPTVANVVSYGVAKKASKNPEAFGKGSPEGLIASEAADNACVGGALIPLITLGIPGCPVTAVLIGALMIHGLTPGPKLFADHPHVVSSIFISKGIAAVWILLNGLVGAKLYAKLLSIPRYVLLPMIMILCMVGAYSISNSLFDVFIMIVFGLFGYGLQKLGIPPAPIVLGLVLGPIFETNLRRSLMLSRGSLMPYLTRPFCLVILGIILLLILLSIVQARRPARIQKNQEGGVS